jgi:short-subunit dehydrogenase
MTFAGKTVAITGAASGIGFALARKFSFERARVALIDFNEDALHEAESRLKREGFDPTPFLCDITDDEALRGTINGIVDTFGRIDLFVNNAGIAVNSRFENITTESFDKTFNVNVRATVQACRFVLPIMKTQGFGTILNMASVAGHIASPYMTAYVAAKHAIVGFSRSLRAELAMDDSIIKVAISSPGFVDTGIISKGKEMGFPEWLSFMLETPEAVAERTVKALKRGDIEIHPTRNGKLMIAAHKYFPKTTIKSSRVLLTRSLKDLLLNRYTIS